MEDGNRVELDGAQALSAAMAQGQGALAGLSQLIKELEPTIGIEAANRVRAKAIEGIKTLDLPQMLERNLVERLD